MSLDRRAFLKLTAAAPCIFGLRQLLLQETDARPEWYKLALARMKERKLHGVVVIAPAAEPEQLELGMQLWDLLDGDFPEAHELFVTGVFMVVTPALAGATGVRTAEEKENRFLLDPDGKRISADLVDPKAFESADAFVASFAPLLHGESDKRLKSRAEELASTLPADVQDALRDLAADTLETRERGSAALLERAGDFAPLYAHRRRTDADPEVRSRLRTVLECHYRSLAADQPGARLPFGTRIPKFREGGCGGLREVSENEKDRVQDMVACGMGRVGDRKVRMFLRFLTK